MVIILEDDEATRECRNKFWENFAIDRCRFQHRISKLVDVLNKVLTASHRNKIYRERFESSEDSGNDSDKDINRIKTKKSKINVIKDDLILNTEENNTSESGFEQEEEETDEEDDVETDRDDDESEFENNYTSNTDEDDDDLVSFSITWTTN